jgi:hypothetical protein
MTTEKKLKRVQELLKNKGYKETTANDAIAETNKYFPLENYSPSYFVEALESTYGIKGLQR